MKKTFSLHAPGKADGRVLDAIKHEVRKYVQRERKKPLPAGAERWRFDCWVGSDAASSQPKQLKDISAAIDEVASAGGSDVYIHIKAVPGN